MDGFLDGDQKRHWTWAKNSEIFLLNCSSQSYFFEDLRKFKFDVVMLYGSLLRKMVCNRFDESLSVLFIVSWIPGFGH